MDTNHPFAVLVVHSSWKASLLHLSLAIIFMSFRSQPLETSLDESLYILASSHFFFDYPIVSLTSQHALICLSCTLSNDLSALLKYKLLEGSYLFCIVGYLKLKSNWASQMHRVNIYKEKNECQLVVGRGCKDVILYW